MKFPFTRYFILFAVYLLSQPSQFLCFKVKGTESTSVETDYIGVQIVDICRKYFYNYTFIVVALTNTSDVVLVEKVLVRLHQGTQIPVVLSYEVGNVSVMEYHDVRYLGKSEAFLLIIEEAHSFQRALTHLQNHYYWNSRAKFVVVTSQDSFHDRSAETVFSVAWNEYKVLQVIVITRNMMCNNSLSIERCIWLFDYNPFQEYAFKPNAGFSVFPGTMDLENFNLFKDKTKCLFGYPIRVAWYDVQPYINKIRDPNSAKAFEGNYGEILETQAELMNFTIIPEIFQDFESGGVYIEENKTWVGLIGDLMKGRADIEPTAVTITYQRSLAIDFSYPIVIDNLAFAVPKAEFRPHWQNLKQPFSLTIWILMFTAFCFISGFITSYNYILRRLNLIQKYQLNSLKLFSLFLSMSLPRLPKSNLLRIVLILTSLFIIVMDNSYEGTLIGFMTRPRRLPDINSFDDISSSGLPIQSILPFMTFILNSPNPTIKSLSFRTKSVSDYKVGVHRVSHEGDAILLSNKNILEYCKFAKFVDMYGDPMFHTAKETINSILLAIAVPKSSPFLPRWNTIAINAIEAGMNKKWLQDYNRKTTRSFYTPKRTEVVLAWEHLQTIFYILVAGIALSTLVFLCELCMVNLEVERVCCKITSSKKAM